MSAPVALPHVSSEELARLWKGLTSGRASALRTLDLSVGIGRSHLVFRGAKLGHRVYAGAGTRAEIEGELTIGDLACFFGGMLGSELIVHRGASLSIGGGTKLNYGTSLEAHQRITVGERCWIGSMVRIDDGRRDGAGPIVIGDDVWIAHGCVIAPDVTIGNRSVVSAGSVVTTSIPEGSLAVGNPARAVRLDLVSHRAEREVGR